MTPDLMFIWQIMFKMSLYLSIQNGLTNFTEEIDTSSESNNIHPNTYSILLQTLWLKTNSNKKNKK